MKFSTWWDGPGEGQLCGGRRRQSGSAARAPSERESSPCPLPPPSGRRGRSPALPGESATPPNTTLSTLPCRRGPARQSRPPGAPARGRSPRRLTAGEVSRGAHAGAGWAWNAGGLLTSKGETRRQAQREGPREDGGPGGAPGCEPRTAAAPGVQRTAGTESPQGLGGLRFLNQTQKATAYFPVPPPVLGEVEPLTECGHTRSHRPPCFISLPDTRRACVAHRCIHASAQTLSPVPLSPAHWSGSAGGFPCLHLHPKVRPPVCARVCC